MANLATEVTSPLLNNSQPDAPVSRGLSDIDKKEAKIRQKMNNLTAIGSGVDSEAELSFITKPLEQRDAYDIAFSKLNPESVAKAKKYNEFLRDLQELGQERNNLTAARAVINEAYMSQRDAINTGANILQQGNALTAQNQLAATQGIAGNLGANVGTMSRVSAPILNQLSAANVQAEAQRQSNLANLAQAEAQVPATLSAIALNEAQTQAQESQTDYYNSRGSSISSPTTETVLSSLSESTVPSDTSNGTTVTVAGKEYIQNPDGTLVLAGEKVTTPTSTTTVRRARRVPSRTI